MTCTVGTGSRSFPRGHRSPRVPFGSSPRFAELLNDPMIPVTESISNALWCAAARNSIALSAVMGVDPRLEFDDPAAWAEAIHDLAFPGVRWPGLGRW